MQQQQQFEPVSKKPVFQFQPTPPMEFKNQKISPNQAEGQGGGGNGLKDLGALLAQKAEQTAAAIQESTNIKSSDPSADKDTSVEEELANRKPIISGQNNKPDNQHRNHRNNRNRRYYNNHKNAPKNP